MNFRLQSMLYIVYCISYKIHIRVLAEYVRTKKEEIIKCGICPI